MIIGITGIFGSGKSSAAKVFSSYGYKVINADEIGHSLLNMKDVKDRVVKEFNNGILAKGRIDRRKLKDIVFCDAKKLVKLNKIIHPGIIREIKKTIKDSKNKKIVIEAPLLIEAKLTNLVDKVVVVNVAEKDAINRALKKKKYAIKEINNIFKSQLSQKEKLKYADIVIDNSKGTDYTRKQIIEKFRLK